MSETNKSERYSFFLIVISWSALWGIFELTIGYLMHSISFAYGWLFWYPVACFFMANAYRKTRRISSVLLVGSLCATIKMLNMLLPGSIDRVLNPAISIVFESLAMAVVLAAARGVSEIKLKNRFIGLLFVLGMNCLWRVLYVLYLLFLVPDWMLKISAISSWEKFAQFFITENLLTSAIISFGICLKAYILKPIKSAERELSNRLEAVPKTILPLFKTSSVLLLLSLNIFLQYIL